MRLPFFRTLRRKHRRPSPRRRLTLEPLEDRLLLSVAVGAQNEASAVESTIGLYNNDSSTFFLTNSNEAGPADVNFRYGPLGVSWRPIVGDWDGDGSDTPGLYDPSEGKFYLKDDNSGGPADAIFPFGSPGDVWVPLAGDWDGNGTTTVGLYNRSDQTFHLKNDNSAGAADLVFRYGPLGNDWTPMVGDWDGDGDETVGIYDPGASRFYLKNSNSAGVADLMYSYGPTGANWSPISGDWNGDGVDTLGLYVPLAGQFYLRNTHAPGAADLSFRYGPKDVQWTPLAGVWNGTTDPVDPPPSPQEPFQVSATGETEDDLTTPGDPAIWIHPTDPSLSTIIGTDKHASPGLHVYDLAGNPIQTLGSSDMVSVDVRYSFPLAGDLVDIVVASKESNLSIAVYKVDPATRQLSNIAARAITTGLTTVRGIALYHSNVSDSFYVFVDSRDGEVEQWELFDTGNGEVDATRVRSFSLSSTVQGVVADDELGYVYISQEDVGIWRYGAEPGDGTARSLVDSTGPDGNLTADVEGVALYQAANGTGYLLVSNQGANAFAIYRRDGNNEFVGMFEIVAGNGYDAVQNTDGIEVTNFPLGSAFPAGVFIAHDDNVNFKLVPWDEIAAAHSSLIVDTSWDPRLEIAD